MSFGYTMLGFGTVATTISAPSSMIIKDDDGTADYITFTIGASTADIAAGSTTSLPSGLTITIGAYSGYTGSAPTSWSWSLTEVSDSDSICTLTAGTTNGEDYEDATIAISGSSEEAVALRLTVTGTNGGGSTVSSNFNFTLQIS